MFVPSPAACGVSVEQESHVEREMLTILARAGDDRINFPTTD